MEHLILFEIEIKNFYTMTKYLLKCKNCGEYGLANPPESKKSEPKCRRCGRELVNPKPPKFSLTDKFSKYRMEYFKEDFKEKFEDKKS